MALSLGDWAGTGKGASAAGNDKFVCRCHRPFLGEWDKGFFDATEELGGYWMELVEGQLPADLEGTLFRCLLRRATSFFLHFLLGGSFGVGPCFRRGREG